ncbi:MAG TPA: VCBS repeat-containing protein [Ktedonobacteraceae bacterium]
MLLLPLVKPSIGDINGDQISELLVQSRDPGSSAMIGLVQYDPKNQDYATGQGLCVLGAQKGAIPGQGIQGSWPIGLNDTYIVLDALSSDSPSSLFVQNQGVQPPAVGVLQMNSSKLAWETIWIAEKSIPSFVPGASSWPMSTKDVYLNLGDINGDGLPELLIQSSVTAQIALLQYNSTEKAFGVLQILSNAVPPLGSGYPSWQMHLQDTYYSVGDINGDGQAEILVQSHNDKNNPYISLLQYDKVKGLSCIWGTVHSIAGASAGTAWTMHIDDKYTVIDDLNQDGIPELMVQSTYINPSSLHDALVGIVKYQGNTANTGGLVSTIVRNSTIPGLSLSTYWQIYPIDTYLSVGDMNADGIPDILVRDNVGVAGYKVALISAFE